MEIAGNRPEFYDRVQIKGNAKIQKSRLSIGFQGGFTPKVGDSFELISVDGGRRIDFSRIVVKGLPRHLGVVANKLVTNGVVTIAKKPSYCHYIKKKNRWLRSFWSRKHQNICASFL